MDAPRHVARLMAEMASNIQKRKALEVEYQALRQQLQDAFKRYNTDEFEVYEDGDIVLQATHVTSTKITYDIDKLKAMLPKKLLKRVIEITVNSQKVEELYDQGLIPIDIIRDCAEMVNRSVITVRRGVAI